MNYINFRIVKLLDIADIENVKKNKVYPAGTIYIQISATRGYVGYLDKASEIETGKHVVVLPKINCNLKYLFYAIKKAMKKFMSKYIQNINIPIGAFSYFEIHLHDLEIQNKIVDEIALIDEMIELTEQEILKNQIIKKNMLRDMFI